MMLAVFALLGICLRAFDVAAADLAKKARPPKPEELVGVWIGFWEDEEFTRLELRADFTGYCAYVAPPDDITHQNGVHVYRVTKWAIDGWKLNLNLTRLDSHAEGIYLKGSVRNESLQLEIGGINRKWKQQVILRQESRIETSNLETKTKIQEAEASPPRTGENKLRAGTALSGWRRVDAGPFSILAPSGWEFHQLEGVDSYVGEFVGDSIGLKFDFGEYPNPFKEERKAAYVVTQKSIGGRRAKIVSPRTLGHGITGVYFRNVGSSNALTLFGKGLTSTQQELALKIFETLRFGGPPPRYVLPPPPAKNAVRR